MNPESRKMLPKIAFSGFATRYREPTLAEGFTDITRVGFQVSQIIRPTTTFANRCVQFKGSEEQKSLWRKYWIS